MVNDIQHQIEDLMEQKRWTAALALIYVQANYSEFAIVRAKIQSLLHEERLSKICRYIQENRDLYSQEAIEQKLIMAGYQKDAIAQAFQLTNGFGGSKTFKARKPRYIEEVSWKEIIIPLFILITLMLACQLLANQGGCNVG